MGFSYGTSHGLLRRDLSLFSYLYTNGDNQLAKPVEYGREAGCHSILDTTGRQDGRTADPMLAMCLSATSYSESLSLLDE